MNCVLFLVDWFRLQNLSLLLFFEQKWKTFILIWTTELWARPGNVHVWDDPSQYRQKEVRTEVLILLIFYVSATLPCPNFASPPADLSMHRLHTHIITDFFKIRLQALFKMFVFCVFSVGYGWGRYGVLAFEMEW